MDKAVCHSVSSFHDPASLFFSPHHKFLFFVRTHFFWGGVPFSTFPRLSTFLLHLDSCTWYLVQYNCWCICLKSCTALHSQLGEWGSQGTTTPRHLSRSSPFQRMPFLLGVTITAVFSVSAECIMFYIDRLKGK